MLAKLLRTRSDLKAKLPALVNDCLLAVSARSLGASHCTPEIGVTSLSSRTYGRFLSL